MAKAKETARVVEIENRKYELMFILQPELLSSAVEKKLKEFEKFLEENGGSVDMKDNLGKKQLAYRIGKHDAGIYVVYNLTLPNLFNQELDEHLRIDKDVIRFLLISLPKGYEYQQFEEEVAPKKIEKTTKPGDTEVSHKANEGEKKSEVKDKGKKADAASLNEKLDNILEGGDLKV